MTEFLMGDPEFSEGLEAVRAYLEHEREKDNDKWKSECLFLSATENAHGNGRLNTRMINTIVEPGV